MADKPLTPLQKRFVSEYLIDLNATQAAIRAGYALAEWDSPPAYYVYALIDPRTDTIFYIGKGKYRRCYQHEKEYRAGRVDNAVKFTRIGEILAAGLNVRVAILDQYVDQRDAYSAERQFVFAIGRDRLSNEANGQTSEEERARVRAQDMLNRVIPFDQWVRSARRTRDDVVAYVWIVHNLKKIADDPSVGASTYEVPIRG